jgi:SPP1 gp7 family putative phage head morphogenesis protein
MYKQWQTIQTLLKDDTMNLRPGYWENVYRTNTQTAYNAGKVMEFEKTHPAAIQLFVIEDSRTSKICRNLLDAEGNGFILPANHPFWKQHGYPPYHFQCRTSIRGIYKSQLDSEYKPGANQPSADFSQFKPQEGFGGNPVAKESWWKMTDGMVERAIKYGVDGDIVNFAITNGIKPDEAEKLLKKYKTVYLGKSDGYVKQSELAKVGTANRQEKGHWVETDELGAAKHAADNGYKIAFLPHTEIDGIKNPEIIINEQIVDIKHFFTPTKRAVEKQ